MFTGYDPPSSDDDNSDAYEIEPIPEVDELDDMLRTVGATSRRASVIENEIQESKSQDEADNDSTNVPLVDSDNVTRALILTRAMEPVLSTIKSGNPASFLKPVGAIICPVGMNQLEPSPEITTSNNHAPNHHHHHNNDDNQSRSRHRRLLTVTSWGFDGLSAHFDDLTEHATRLLCDRILQPLQTTRPTIFNFVNEVRTRYIAANPYHNFRHAVDVCHTCYKFLRITNAIHFMESLDLAAILISGLVHDVGHPAVNKYVGIFCCWIFYQLLMACYSAFLIATGHDMALLYNDRSPLEMMHIATLFQDILRVPNANILEHISPSKYKEIRRRIVLMVLATDMGFHFEQVSQLQVFTNVNKDVLPYTPLLHKQELGGNSKKEINSPNSLEYNSSPSHTR